ncbi:MAG TPA: biotin/lipoyl-containing protein [Candidatus Limnocylindrales bacterium]|nr:biotin/lipoyl-containing protein [Candidatus Limnocylindrales bacterium]
MPTRERGEIRRLSQEVLPALIARLGASELAELEVAENGWRVRLRKPAGGGSDLAGERRSGLERRHQPRPRQEAPAGGATPAAAAVPAPEGATATAPAGPSTDGRGSSADGQPAADPVRTLLSAVGPGRGEPAAATRVVGRELSRVPATSPAVGYYLPLEGMATGHRVHAGDVIGHIDVLGVRQEVVAPADGVVGRLLAQQGEAVEYGQELLRIDLVASAAAAEAGG